MPFEGGYRGVNTWSRRERAEAKRRGLERHRRIRRTKRKKLRARLELIMRRQR